jgi:hypothetical protein
MFNQQNAAPKQINIAILALDVFYRLFKAGDNPALDSEDIEKLVPERLSLGVLASFCRPIVGKAYGVMPYFVPAEGH